MLFIFSSKAVTTWEKGIGISLVKPWQVSQVQTQPYLRKKDGCLCSGLISQVPTAHIHKPVGPRSCTFLFPTRSAIRTLLAWPRHSRSKNSAHLGGEGARLGIVVHHLIFAQEAAVNDITPVGPDEIGDLIANQP